MFVSVTSLGQRAAATAVPGVTMLLQPAWPAHSVQKLAGLWHWPRAQVPTLRMPVELAA
jgi:hypothetical protein